MEPSLITRFFQIVLPLVLISIFNTACPSSPGGNGPERIKVTGDPLAFIEGSTEDTSSGIPEDLFTDDGEWQLEAKIFVTTRQKKIQNGNIESGNEPTAGEVTEKIKEDVNLYSMKPGRTEDELVFDSASSEFAQLVFKKQGNAIFLKSLIDYDNPDVEDFDFTLHHYSVREDKKAFSLLISGSADFDSKIEHEKILMALYFFKKENDTVLAQMLDTAYNYLLGPGVKLAWDQDKEVEALLCSDSGSMYSYLTLSEQAVDEWNVLLENRLQLTAVRSTSMCPPFSDLNTHIIRHVKDWVFLEGPQYLSAAVTLTAANVYESRIEDSDIFVMEGEFDELLKPNDLAMGSYYVSSDSEFRESYKWNIVHELGHFLGLHHIFDGTLSVMAYSDNNQLYTYDREAVQELYPVVTVPLAPDL